MDCVTFVLTGAVYGSPLYMRQVARGHPACGHLVKFGFQFLVLELYKVDMFYLLTHRYIHYLLLGNSNIGNIFLEKQYYFWCLLIEANKSPRSLL